MTPDIRRTRNAGHTEYGNTLSMLYRGINVRHKKQELLTNSEKGTAGICDTRTRPERGKKQNRLN